MKEMMKMRAEINEVEKRNQNRQKTFCENNKIECW